MRRSAWIAGVWLIARLHAQAQDSRGALPLELAWRAPPECPSAAEVRAQLEHIARPRPGSALAPLRAHAEVEPRAPGYVLHLVTEHAGERGERQLEASDCTTLVRSLTLVMALAYGAGVEMTERDATPQAPPPSAAPAKPEDHREPSATPLAFHLALGPGLALGPFPRAALATALAVEAATPAWSLGLRFSVWPALAAIGATNRKARFDGLAGTLQACHRTPLARFELGLCAGARAAALRGRSVGATADGSAVAPWYSMVGAAALTWPRDAWLALRVDAGLAGSLDRPRFVIDGIGSVQRVPSLTADFDAWLLIAL